MALSSSTIRMRTAGTSMGTGCLLVPRAAIRGMCRRLLWSRIFFANSLGLVSFVSSFLGGARSGAPGVWLWGWLPRARNGDALALVVVRHSSDTIMWMGVKEQPKTTLGVH